ncbi:MAG: alpha/beta fold hydrolase [Acidimicrobiia bacterium]
MQVPETKYARTADGLRLAYQQWGEGPPVLIIPPLVSNVEVGWEHPNYRRVDDFFGRHLQCALFDKRGVGLSDRPDEQPTLEQRIGDIITILDVLEWDRASLVGLSEGGVMSQLFAAEHPERIDRLVLGDTFLSPRYWHLVPDHLEPGDPPLKTPAETVEAFETLVEGWPENTEYFLNWFVPSQVHDPVSFRWFGRLQRLSASPRDFARQVESVMRIDAGDAPERITAPTMVSHVKGDRVLHVAMGRVLADVIPGARYVEYDGEDHFPWLMDNWREQCDVSIEFLSGTAPVAVTTRRFATVLFTDIVGSTRRSAELGDARWREILDRHDRLTHGLVDEHGGRIVKSTGDGLLAVFDVPSQGVECGTAMCRALSDIDVPIRAGVHAGEIEVHDDGDVSGIAVNLAARVEQAAADGELWASSTVRDMMLGGAAGFEERGEHELKGIDGAWKLFAVR